MKENVVLGIDIGGTNTKFGFVNKDGEILYKGSIKTDGRKDAADFFERLFNEIKPKINEINLKGIGLGAPCGNYYNGTIEYPPNMDWGFVNVKDELSKYIDVPFVITNDANSAAVGEQFFGLGKNKKNFIEVTLGTGLGCGIIVDGKILHGFSGFAGELGHYTVKENGRLCGCGKRGCLETYASATGIKRTMLELLSSENGETSFRKIAPDKINSKMIYDEAINGDQLALKAFEKTGEVLGKVLANVSALFSPEVVFLFGGLANADKFIIEPTKRHLEANIMSLFKEQIEIVKSGLDEADAAILGSAALIWQELDELN